MNQATPGKEVKQMLTTINGVTFRLSREGIADALCNVKPDPIYLYYVIVSGKHYPPNQVLERATGLLRVECKTVRSVPILSRLGFKVYRTK